MAKSTEISRRAFNSGMLGLVSLGAASANALASDSSNDATATSHAASSGKKIAPPKHDWAWELSTPASARGRNGVIASTRGGKPLEDAIAMLSQGGNAMDAAMSAAIAQVVYAAGSWVSLAGLITLTCYEAASGKVFSMNAGFNTVQDERDPLTIPKSSLIDRTQPDYVTSGRAVLVPGFFAGVHAMHEKFGSVPFARLFDSGIGIASDGVYVTPGLASYIKENRAHFSRLPETKAIFTKANGELYEEGDVFVQPVLAKTLRTIGERGVDYVYRGEWAKKFVAGVRADGGKMTMKDLADYKVEWGEPIHTRYRGHDVYAHHQAHFMLGQLALAAAGNLASMGRYYESPETFYWYHRIFRATGTNMAIMGERINQLAVPSEDWLDPAKVAAYWQQIRAGTFPEGPRDGRAHHSDSIVVVDRAGNIVALTHSTNTGNIGRYIDGISLPAPAANQQQHLQKVGPGRKLPNFLPCVIAMKDGKPVIATAAIGQALHQETVKVITNVIDYGKAGREAVDAPSFVEPYYQAAGTDKAERVLSGDYTPELLDGVRAKGMEIEEVAYPVPPEAKKDERLARGPGIGLVATVVIDPATREYEGVSSRTYGGALGY